jgi:hypothetical protein
MSVALVDVRAVLEQVRDPVTSVSLSSAVKDSQIQIAGGRVSIQVVLGYPAASRLEVMRQALLEALKAAGAGAEPLRSCTRASCVAAANTAGGPSMTKPPMEATLWPSSSEGLGQACIGGRM